MKKKHNNFHLCLLVLSTAHSSNIGAYCLIDIYQHIMISVPVQGIWDGVTLSTGMNAKYHSFAMLLLWIIGKRFCIKGEITRAFVDL